MNSTTFANDGFITLTTEEEELLQKASDLQSAISARRESLRRLCTGRVYIRHPVSGDRFTYELVVGFLEDFSVGTGVKVPAPEYPVTTTSPTEKAP